MKGHDEDAKASNVGNVNGADAPDGLSARTAEAQPTANAAPAGIFSSPDMTVETTNLPPELGGPQPEEAKATNKSRVAAAFGKRGGGNNQARIDLAFAGTEAVQEGVVARSNSIASSAEGDIQLQKSAKKKSKAPIFIFALLLCAACAGLVIYILQAKQGNEPSLTGEIGTVNTALLFDKTAPIPAESLDEADIYGYLNPEDGSWAIEPSFYHVTDFYGQYAVAKVKNTNSGIVKTLVINRTGQTQLELEENNESTYYDIDNNLWVVDGDAYDSQLKKISPDGTKSRYLGYGYFGVAVYGSTPVSVLNDQKTDDTDDDTADQDETQQGTTQQTTPSGSDQSTANEMTGEYINNTYIADEHGEKFFTCEGNCTIFLMTDNTNKVFAVVRGWGEPARVVSLPSGEIIYTASGTNTLQLGSDDILTERSSNGIKYMKIENGKIVPTQNTFAKDAVIILEYDDEYVVSQCGNGALDITKNDSEEIFGCDIGIDSVLNLSRSVALAYEQAYNQLPVFVTQNGTTKLYDLKTKQLIVDYGAVDVTTFDNSPFFSAYNYKQRSIQACNLLLGPESTCLNVTYRYADLLAGGDYLKASDESGQYIIFNYNLKVVR